MKTIGNKSIMKILLSFIILSFATEAFAQRHLTTTAWNHLQHNELDQAKETIDKASVHSQTSQDARTWYYRGFIYSKIAASEEFLHLHENPLLESYESFKIALSFDKSGRYKNDILNSLQNIAIIFFDLGSGFFEKKEFANSAINFDRYLEAISLLGAKIEDTTAYFYAGYTHFLDSNYEKAIPRMKKAMDLQYKSHSTALILSEMYLIQGDTNEALKVLKKGREIYPGEDDIVKKELNIYIDQNRMDDAIQNLKEAIELDPDNLQLYVVLGTAYEEVNNTEKAMETFKLVLENEPDNFEANFRIGISYFNRGAIVVNEAAEIRDRDKYAEHKKKFEALFKTALPYLEKAHEINESDHNTILALMQIYLRLGNEKKADEMNAKMEGIIQQQ